MRESDRLSRLLSEFLDFARVRVARTETGRPRGRWHEARRASRPRIPIGRRRCRSRATLPRATQSASKATKICCTARCSTSRSTPSRRRRRAARCASRSCAAECDQVPPGMSFDGDTRVDSRVATTARASHRRSATGCSIRSSRRSRTARAWASPSCTAPSRRTAASCSSTAALAARASR